MAKKAKSGGKRKKGSQKADKRARESRGQVGQASLLQAGSRAQRQGGGLPKSGAVIAPGDARKAADLRKGKSTGTGKPVKKAAAKPKVDEFAGCSKSKKRKLIKQEKIAKKNPKFDTVVDTNKFYSQLIDSSKQERDCEGLVSQILKRVDDSPVPLSTFAESRGGSRAVQACLKWGTLAQRKQICDKLVPQLDTLATRKYGVVVVEKLFRYGDKEVVSRKGKKVKSSTKSKGENVPKMTLTLTGAVLKKLAFHRTSCRLLNFVYHYLTSRACKIANAKAHQRRILLELCLNQAGRAALEVGRLMISNPASLPSLKEVLHREGTAKIDDELHGNIVSHLHEVCRRTVDKELLLYQMWHNVWQQYCAIASESQLEELANHAEEGLPLLLSSRPGAEAMIRLLGVSSAKIKRHLCRALKGQWKTLATNEVDYVVLMRLVDTVDDTVLLSKTMFAELGDEMRALAFDKHGSKVLVHILTMDADPKRRRRVMTPYELGQLAIAAPVSRKELSLRCLEVCPKVTMKLRTEFESARAVAEFAADVSARTVLVEYLARTSEEAVVSALLQAVSDALQQGHELKNFHYVLAALKNADKEGILKLGGEGFSSRLEKILPQDRRL